MDNAGRLCICDFGLARKYGSPLRPYTQSVVTLWYRAPEILLGTDVYGPAVDMWSVGCIFAEFVTKKPLLPGQSELEQLDRIFRITGTPTNDSWPGWASLPNAKDLARGKTRSPANLRQELSLGLTPFSGAPFLSDAGLDLLRRMLTPDPARRISAADALRHAWFEESPAPADQRLMPAFPSKHDTAAAHAATMAARVGKPAAVTAKS
jgi:cell division cycle 2-like protein